MIWTVDAYSQQVIKTEIPTVLQKWDTLTKEWLHPEKSLELIYIPRAAEEGHGVWDLADQVDRSWSLFDAQY